MNEDGEITTTGTVPDVEDGDHNVEVRIDHNNGPVDIDLSEQVRAQIIPVAVKIHKRLEKELDDGIAYQLAEAERKQKEVEDVRANKRNQNRFYTLCVALAMTFIVPFVLAQMGLVSVLKYATGIAIVPDALITAWAYRKRY